MSGVQLHPPLSAAYGNDKQKDIEGVPKLKLYIFKLKRRAFSYMIISMQFHLFAVATDWIPYEGCCN